MADAITPLELAIAEADFVDLRDRLARTRWPEARPSTTGPRASAQLRAGAVPLLGDRLRLATDRSEADADTPRQMEMLARYAEHRASGTGYSKQSTRHQTLGYGLVDSPASLDVPTGLSIFPKDIFPISRRWAEQRFTDLRHYDELPRGGHFAAFDQPELFVDELRTFFRLVR